MQKTCDFSGRKEERVCCRSTSCIVPDCPFEHKFPRKYREEVNKVVGNIDCIPTTRGVWCFHGLTCYDVKCSFQHLVPPNESHDVRRLINHIIKDEQRSRGVKSQCQRRSELHKKPVEELTPEEREKVERDNQKHKKNKEARTARLAVENRQKLEDRELGKLFYAFKKKFETGKVETGKVETGNKKWADDSE